MPKHSRWNLEAALRRVLRFRDARDWKRFHRPKELAAALAIEAAELQEIFLWRASESSRVVRGRRALAKRTEEEIADVAIYLLLLAHELDVDLDAAVARKLDANARRYTVAQHRGVAKKAAK